MHDQELTTIAEFSNSRTFRKRDTEMEKGQGGIQMLLAAEQEAQQIIAAAKAGYWCSSAAKATRVKEAKEEAEREVAEYRAKCESEFRKKLAESNGDSGSNIKRLDREMKRKIENLKEQASKVSPQVVNLLLKYVTSVKN
ncbi:hypothetical protein KP509_34G042000 [Ceratopteris richardii]|uniref:V-type proton ATPase subunit G n=1 Tax=Ceratopteris richardii TaxID=49495 RepID=A0A8T2QLN1_CERRI|nr:hypothetical protein KP509_34G042000 [Ceratopteris richardii]